MEQLKWKEWRADPHLINRIQWDEKETGAISDVLKQDWFGYGEPNKKLEKKISEFTGLQYVNLTNSGSSAILVAIKSLIHAGRVKPGDLVLHPITTFATSISSAIDLGLIPVYIETKQNTYEIDPEEVEKAIALYPEIKGLIVPYLLGGIPDMERIKKALDGRFLIEDSCDTLGGTFDGKHLGHFADFTAFSFYGSHHISTAGVGGALATNDSQLAEIARSMIFWGRDFSLGDAFLDRYKYKTIGTNSQLSAIQAAFGLAQIEKLPMYVKAREKQFEEMSLIFRQFDFFNLPESHPKAKPSWFGYPLIVKENAPFTREQFVKYLAENRIEIRPIMCGNILKQAPFKAARHLTISPEHPIAEQIERTGLFLPCWGMPEEQKKHYYSIINSFLWQFKQCGK